MQRVLRGPWLAESGRVVVRESDHEVRVPNSRIDADAMKNPEHYWPVLVEQMRDDLL